MTHVLRALSVTALCIAALTANAADLEPEDFAFGAKVLTPGAAAAYRTPLPLSLYQKVVRGDLGDMRVFNERGELVPHRIERPASESTVQAAPVTLPVFALPGAYREALRITVESGGTRIDVRTPAASGPSSGTASSPSDSYLIDGRAHHSPVSGFNLSWPDDAEDFAGRLSVEASDDLSTWRTIVRDAPIANLRATNGRILERRIDLPPTTAQFWRLSWSGKSAPFEITGVTAEPAGDRVEATRATLAIQGKREVGQRRGEFTFDLGAQVPVDRVNLELPEQNSIVQVELFTRIEPGEDWRFVTRSGFYRLQSSPSTADFTNGPVALDARSDRYWLARVDVSSGGLGRTAPTLRVGWLPHEVVFLARGAGPFTLAYGNGIVQASTSLGAIPANASIVNASLAEPQTLGGPERLDPKARPRTWWSRSTILWTVLGAGVALLAFMAYRLANELKHRP